MSEKGSPVKRKTRLEYLGGGGMTRFLPQKRVGTGRGKNTIKGENRRDV